MNRTSAIVAGIAIFALLTMATIGFLRSQRPEPYSPPGIGNGWTSQGWVSQGGFTAP